MQSESATKRLRKFMGDAVSELSDNRATPMPRLVPGLDNQFLLEIADLFRLTRAMIEKERFRSCINSKRAAQIIVSELMQVDGSRKGRGRDVSEHVVTPGSETAGCLRINRIGTISFLSERVTGRRYVEQPTRSDRRAHGQPTTINHARSSILLLVYSTIFEPECN
jgi:hypothetical protein